MKEEWVRGAEEKKGHTHTYTYIRISIERGTVSIKTRSFLEAVQVTESIRNSFFPYCNLSFALL